MTQVKRIFTDKKLNTEKAEDTEHILKKLTPRGILSNKFFQWLKLRETIEKV